MDEQPDEQATDEQPHEPEVTHVVEPTPAPSARATRRSPGAVLVSGALVAVLAGTVLSSGGGKRGSGGDSKKK